MRRDYGDSLLVARLTFSLDILDCDAPAFPQDPSRFVDAAQQA